MLRIRFLPLLIIVLCAAFSVSAQFQVRVKFGEIANLTYQLDCVADLPINCSRENFRELWKKEFLKNEADRRMIKEWTRLREFYSKGVQLSNENDKNSASIDLFDKIRIAGWQANDANDYATRLDLLTIPSDRRMFEAVVRHFQPAFNRWWQREAAKSGEVFAKQTEALLRSAKIAETMRRIFYFYQPILPADYEISFNLFYLPDLVKEPSGGQQLENYSLMEFRPKERPEQRIDVAVHELSHFFYDSIKPESRVKLEKVFQSSTRASAIPAYNLLNEALAAAFGNGIVAREVTPPADFEEYVASPGSFYNNPAIDRAAKAVLPLADDWLKNQKTIDDADFAAQYIAALEKAFGEELLAPKLYLSEMFLLIDAKLGGTIRRDARRILEAASFYSNEGDLADENIFDEYENQPRLNALLIVRPESVSKLVARKIISAAQAQQVQTEFQSKKSVLFGTTRAPLTYVYIIVAEDAAAASKSMEKLARAKQFQGIYDK